MLGLLGLLGPRILETTGTDIASRGLDACHLQADAPRVACPAHVVVVAV
jgi:hypothetical protein